MFTQVKSLMMICDHDNDAITPEKEDDGYPSQDFDDDV